MPRSKQSFESKILEWFEGTPLPSAEMLLGLVQASVRARKPALPPARKKKAPPSKVPSDVYQTPERAEAVREA